MNIYFFNYNNYFLRKVKKIITIDDIISEGWIFETVNANFNDNDGVNATLVMGDQSNQYKSLTMPDYAVVVNNGEISSRWFVLECVKTRKGQYSCKLRRDLMSDFNDAILDSTSFIKKGTSANFTLQCIGEEQTFNQIKKGEYLLKNNLGVPWLVCYLPRYDTGGHRLNYVGSTTVDEFPDYVVSRESDYVYYKYISANGHFSGDMMSININYMVSYPDGPSEYYKMILTSNGAIYDRITPSEAGDQYLSIKRSNSSYNMLLTYPQAQAAWNQIIEEYNKGSAWTLDNNILINSFNGSIRDEVYNELLDEDDKIIEINENEDLSYRKIEVTTHRDIIWNNVISSDSTAGSIISSIIDYKSPHYNTYNIMIQSLGDKIVVTSNEITPQRQIEYDITYADVNNNVSGPHTQDAPYEIVAFPYGSAAVAYGGPERWTTKEISLAVAEALMKGSATTDENGNAAEIINKAYDAQIVPYIQYDDTYEVTHTVLTAPGSNVIEIKQGESIVGWGLKLTRATFSMAITNSDIIVRENVKESVVLDKYRLVSPNGVGEYEFSFAKNGGNKGFEADVTLMPINPYIKINPVFGGLYGSDFNDYRGLICNGDYSIPFISNAWIDYQIQNKNFAANFKNTLRSNDISHYTQMVQSSLGMANQAVNGLMSGNLGYEDAAGAMASIAIMAASAGISEVQYRKQRNIIIQNFENSIANVQAQAETLGKTTPFNANNKYFPYVEYYTCSDRGLELFRKQLKYSGQTLNIIGTIRDYYNGGMSFIQGYIIDSAIQEDAHVLEEINAELAQGVRYVMEEE
jgi:hypothetical protein